MSRPQFPLFNRVTLKTKVPPHIIFSNLTNNSRAATNGTLFFCIRGTLRDGNQFISEVNAQGAAAVVVEDELIFDATPNAILVTNVREAYALACADWFGHPSQKVKVVAVTGTNGKTTTSFLITELLESWGWKMGLLGTVEYRSGKTTVGSNLTTPDAWLLQENLASMAQNKVPAVALEASSIALHQHRLTGTDVQVAVFTNLTQDHLDYHHTWENYFDAKCRLFFEMRPHWSVVNLDDSWGQKLAGRVSENQLFTFSASGNQKARLRAHDCRMSSRGTLGKITHQNETLDFELQLIGQHNIANALAAVGAALTLGMPFKNIITALPVLKGAPGRLERVPLPPAAPQVFVDYAHSPDALEKVTQTLKSVVPTGGRLLTVFGAGGDRDRSKRPLMAAAVAAVSDVVIITSDNPRTESAEAIIEDLIVGMGDKPFQRQSDRARAIALALELATPKDLVLIAGKGHETYQIIGTEKRDFDDRKVVSAAYFAQNRVLR